LNTASVPLSLTPKLLASMLLAELPEAMKVAPATLSIVPEPGAAVPLALLLKRSWPGNHSGVGTRRRANSSLIAHP